MKKKEFYSLLNQKSLNTVPCFFVIDFLQKKFILKDLKDVNLSQDILINFPFFSNCTNNKNYIKNIKLQPNAFSREKFYLQFQKVHKEIQFGNSYLVNLTFEIQLKNQESLNQIFHLAHEKYKLFINNSFVCFSPETFIRIVDDKIFTYPMKGTINAKIKNSVDKLIGSEKELAEHSTIVDLLRNDLSIISDKVFVEKFRYIEKIKSNQNIILQTSSKIQGIIKKKYKNKIGSILQKILPAGSISGAPKKNTLKIIQSIESHQRGFYSGIAGVFDGKNLDTCVLIRFIEKKNNILFYKTGVGIHYLSDVKKEFEEIKNKIYVPIF